MRAAKEHARWVAENKDDQIPTASVTLPPRELADGEIKLSKSLTFKSAGCWFVWTTRGPLLCVRGREANAGWSIKSDPVICEYNESGWKKLDQWLIDKGLHRAVFRTRREALLAIQVELLEGRDPGADQAAEELADAALE